MPTVLSVPGGTSESVASAVAPRIDRPAVTRDATTFETNDTVTSGVGSVYGAAPPASTVRAKKAFVDAPAGTSAFWIGLKYGVPSKLKVPGVPWVTMSANQSRTESRMPALGTRMPRSSDGKPPLSAYSSGCANSGTKVTVPGDVLMLAACVAGPFCRSAAVAPPTALPWIVRGVATTGQRERALVKVLHERIEELQSGRHRQRLVRRIRHDLVTEILDLENVARRAVGGRQDELGLVQAIRRVDDRLREVGGEAELIGHVRRIESEDPGDEPLRAGADRRVAEERPLRPPPVAFSRYAFTSGSMGAKPDPIRPPSECPM